MDSRDERPFSYSVTGDYPVVMLLVPLILGILAANSLYSLLSSRLTLMVIVTVALALCFSLLLLLRQGRGMLVLTRLCLMATALSFGALLTVVSLRNVLVAFPAEKAVYGGVIVSEPRVRGGSVRMRVMTGAVWDGGRAMKRSGVVELTTVADSSTRSLVEGDAIIFEGIVRAPANAGNPYETDYASYLIHHGVGGTAFVYPDALKRASAAESVRLRERCLGAGYRARLWGDHVRMRLMDVYRSVGLTGGGLALVAAMTIGSKDLLTPATRSLFSEAGVSHVLALSGLHLSIIFAILELLLAGGMRTGRRARIAQVVIIAFVWTFALVAGLPMSLVRASVMYTIMALCLMTGRGYSSLTALSLAAFVILLLSPLALYDVGFQLSFLSVFAIITLYPVIAPTFVTHGTFIGRLWGAMAVSIAAQAATAPLVAYYFHNFPLYFILSNLLIVPLSAVVTAGGLLLLLISLIAPLASLLAALLGGVLSLMQRILSFIAALPMSSLALYPTERVVLLLYAAFAFVVTAALLRRRSLLMPAIALLVASAIVSASDRRAEKRFAGVYFYRNISASVIHFIEPSGESLLYAPPEVPDTLLRRATAGIARQFWRRCRLLPPRRLPETMNGEAIRRRGSLVLFGGRFYVVLDSTTPRDAVPTPLRAEALYVARGYRGDFRPWLKQIRAAHVLLDARLSPWQRARCVQACRAAGIRPVDLATDRAPVCR